MYINATGYYIPSERIYNEYFSQVNGLTSDWISKRTGIKTRSKVSPGEDGVSMGKAAVADALYKLPYPINDVELIISAGYTPVDTVGTLAHAVQRDFNIPNATAMMMSSACSSFVTALEIVEGYFCANRANKALIVCSEHNSYYCNETDPQSGHLWGDAAVAMFVSKEKISKDEPEILNMVTKGLGHIGKGPEGVSLNPKMNGIVMSDGRDVFVNAIIYMIDALETVIKKSNIKLNDLAYIIPHQANLRIINTMINQLKLPETKVLTNIQNYGNTGSASAILVMLENLDKFHKNDIVGVTVFGGGYSSGGMLVQY